MNDDLPIVIFGADGKPEPPPTPEPEVTEKELQEVSVVLDIDANPEHVKSLVKLGRMVEKKGVRDLAIGMLYTQISRNKEIRERWHFRTLGPGQDAEPTDKEFKLEMAKYFAQLDKLDLEAVKQLTQLGDTSAPAKTSRKKFFSKAPKVYRNPAIGILSRQSQHK